MQLRVLLALASASSSGHFGLGSHGQMERELPAHLGFFSVAASHMPKHRQNVAGNLLFRFKGSLVTEVTSVIMCNSFAMMRF